MNAVPSRSEVLEGLVALYFRLNGYFCIRNYLYHRALRDFAIQGASGLATESDILALRMAHQVEELPNGAAQQNDPLLVVPVDRAKTDCVIAEVKEARIEFNQPLRQTDGSGLIQSALKMFGQFPPSEFAASCVGDCLARELHSKLNKSEWDEFPAVVEPHRGVIVRMVVFSRCDAVYRAHRKFISLEHVLDFTRKRMQPAQVCAPYTRDSRFSPWRGIERVITQVLDEACACGRPPMTLDELVNEAMRYCKSSAVQDSRTDSD